MNSRWTSLGDLYIKGHRIVPTGVRDDELVLPVLLRCYFHRTFWAGRVVLADFLAGRVIDVQIHVRILRAVRGSLELLSSFKGKDVCYLALVLHLDLLTFELRPLAQVSRFNILLRRT